MKIAHIFYELKYSGAEIMYTGAAHLFNESEYELHAIASGPSLGDFSHEFKRTNFKISHLPFPQTSNPLTFYRYSRDFIIYLKTHSIDIVHIHTNGFHWLVSLLATISGVRVIRTFHNCFKHRPHTWIKGYLERFTSRRLFRVVQHSIGETVYENELKYYKNPSIQINNWYDPTKFFPASSVNEKKHLREKLGLPENQCILISVGGCSPIKNHHDILRAISSLSNTQYTYVHLGCGVTEQEEKELASQLGISGQVLFLGNNANVRDYLIASDIYIMTSQFEGLSISGIEAMACGLPVIFYNAPGLKDLIKSHATGMLIDPTIDALQQSIQYLMNNYDIATHLGNEAATFVATNFSQKEGVHGLINLYKKNY